MDGRFSHAASNRRNASRCRRVCRPGRVRPDEEQARCVMVSVVEYLTPEGKTRRAVRTRRAIRTRRAVCSVSSHLPDRDGRQTSPCAFSRHAVSSGGALRCGERRASRRVQHSYVLLSQTGLTHRPRSDLSPLTRHLHTYDISFSTLELHSSTFTISYVVEFYCAEMATV